VVTALIPLCWPDARGRCADGRGHREKAIGKAPLVFWEALVTAPPTTEQIQQWASEYPGCNWGQLLEPAGACVIDLDGEAARGEAIGYGLPPAIVATTGQGSHYYYKAPAQVAGRRTAKRGHSQAIDILAGGYVVIPPSRHRAGSVYRWIIPPEARPLADPPEWAVRMLLEAPAGGAAADVALPIRLPDVDLEGLRVSPRIRALILTGVDARYPSRSEAVFAVAQALIHAGQPDAMIAAVLMDVRYGISAKPRDLGRRWLAHELARARAKSRVEVFA
jgi:bifunctional DNA primase/polymerase-like protein